jgi:hypothetical protein
LAAGTSVATDEAGALMVSRHPIRDPPARVARTFIDRLRRSTMMIRPAVIRTAAGLCAAAVLTLVTTAPVSTQQPPFEATITLTGDAEVCVGEVGAVYVDWSTNRDVTRSQWSVGADVEPEGEVSGSSGSDSRTFSSTEEGQFTIRFALRHHTQSDRGASEEFQVTVVACLTDDCPAAPAVANDYLDGIGYSDGRGWIINQVAAAMNAGLFGDDTCDPSYAELVHAFVEGLL